MSADFSRKRKGVLMKKIAVLLTIVAISLLALLAAIVSSESAPSVIGKWELVRVEYADGKSKPQPSKPKMGGAEFFNDKTVAFSDGLKGEWTTLPDGRINIILMGFLEMFGSMQGDLLKLYTEVDPNEIMVLKKR
jgi:hypothetical protein